MATVALTIAPMSSADWPAVREIYAQGITTGDATFEISAPEWADWDIGHLGAPRLVAREGADVVGWAALSPVSDRCVYGGVAEVSVYVAAEVAGRGVGSALMRALIAASEEAGIWTLQAGIFPENEASIALHRRHGFRPVGIRERLGRHHGRWRDVALLERRSSRIGVD